VNDKLRRRENLLRIAREVFAKKGYQQTKVDDIARAARVAKGTLYLYFPDKSSIMQELLDRIVVVLQGAIMHVDPNGDLQAQIKHNIRAIVGVFLDDPTLPQILLSTQTGGDPDFQRRLADFMKTVTDLLAKAMADGQDLGIVVPGQPYLQACFTLGWAEGGAGARDQGGGDARDRRRRDVRHAVGGPLAPHGKDRGRPVHRGEVQWPIAQDPARNRQLSAVVRLSR
jgi:AcrR family transcriptional regulator